LQASWVVAGQRAFNPGTGLEAPGGNEPPERRLLGRRWSGSSRLAPRLSRTGRGSGVARAFEPDSLAVEGCGWGHVGAGTSRQIPMLEPLLQLGCQSARLACVRPNWVKPLARASRQAHRQDRRPCSRCSSRAVLDLRATFTATASCWRRPAPQWVTYN